MNATYKKLTKSLITQIHEIFIEIYYRPETYSPVNITSHHLHSILLKKMHRQTKWIHKQCSFILKSQNKKQIDRCTIAGK